MSPKSGCLRTIRGCAWGRVQWRVARLPRVPTIVTPTPNPTPPPPFAGTIPRVCCANTTQDTHCLVPASPPA